MEHDKIFVWNKDNLEELYSKNINQFRLYPVTGIETWLLDDNTALMITSEIMDEDLVLDMTISEVKGDNRARTPAHIDPRR
jgi:hypothetical protein